MKKLLLILTLLIAVAQNVQAADAVLSWTAPTTNVDGSPLTDLAGYKIYWGLVSGVYTQNKVLTVAQSSCTSAPGITTCTNTITGFLADNKTWYFVVTAYDTSNNESAFSNQLSKTFLDTIAPSAPILVIQ